ncbi:MAG: QueT transporter family protein [Clostridia bacterium]|nr:QueT transporter family protein [Clostridia bacterium]
MNNTAQSHVNTLTRAAIIAALYAALTLLLSPLSFGLIQVRVSEAMTLLPILLPEAVPALAVGCLIANILGGCTILDIVFGTLSTLLAAASTRLLRSRPLPAMLMPVLFNGAIVGAVVHTAYTPSVPLVLCMLSVAAGEAVSCLLLGPLLLRAVKRIPAKMLHS